MQSANCLLPFTSSFIRECSSHNDSIRESCNLLQSALQEHLVPLIKHNFWKIVQNAFLLIQMAACLTKCVKLVRSCISSFRACIGHCKIKIGYWYTFLSLTLYDKRIHWSIQYAKVLGSLWLTSNPAAVKGLDCAILHFIALQTCFSCLWLRKIPCDMALDT